MCVIIICDMNSITIIILCAVVLDGEEIFILRTFDVFRVSIKKRARIKLYNIY
jgi:hypothetical protein